VNDVKITKMDLFKSMLRRVRPSAYVDSLIDDEVLFDAAAKQGITATDKEMEDAYNRYVESLPNKDMFLSYEREIGGHQQLLYTFKRRVVLVKLGERLTRVSDMDLDDSVQASHILIKVANPPQQPDGKPDAQAKALAEDILKQAQQPGADFAALAKKYSDDTSKDKGGDLGYFSRSMMVQPFEKAAWALKVGEMSGLVKSPYGYHIIKVTGRKTGTDAQRAQKRDELILSRTSEATRLWMEEQKKKADIKRFQLAF
jgi:foldase protein PrsA